ncbi:LysR family transcriptional regulator [Nostoc sp. LPT]|uniref:LysR family transcriptional regulator n=1 Tax=Nostoc sp. LPT TaxID=2815387 RepID=UPI001D74D384|nr:LysR family transcriptional regulator [Nostoc sp. LPT]MBN4003851.1 LysR family transcriptional regulator [Nostoc sp. LPT]
MNLERLARFVFLATLKNDTGQKDINVSRAAEKLHIPQPHLSNQIKQLEEELGVELFVRKPRLELTPYGKVFLQEAQHLLEQVERIHISAKQASQGEIGRLIVGINTSISNSLLPNILRVFRQKYPNVDLVLQELLFEDSRQKLQARTLDVDFENFYNLQDVDDRHFLTYEVINQQPLVMVLPKEHPLIHYPQVQLQDFKAEPFVLPCYERVSGLHTLIRMACLSAGFHPKVVQEAAWMTTILGLVAGEIGVALLPANVMNLQRTGVVYRKIQGQLPVFKIAIAWRRDNQSKILSNFLNVVREVSRS